MKMCCSASKVLSTEINQIYILLENVHFISSEKTTTTTRTKTKLKKKERKRKEKNLML